MRFNYFLITAILLFSGCIKNDIPYPVRKGAIQEIEFRGQESVTIDDVNMVIDVVLADTTDMQNVQLAKFVVSEKTTTLPVVEVPMMIDRKSVV